MKSVRVLLVDDFKPFRQWARSKLESQKQFELVGEATGAVEAIQKTQELRPDLIVLDVVLPDINGIEAARQICRLVPSTKILFLSRHADEDIAQCALSVGAKGYVVKSDAERDFLPALEKVLRGGEFVSSGVRPHRPLHFAALVAAGESG